MLERLRLENVVNDECPWSGDPVSEDSLALYRGHVVGFCNRGCRDKFAAAVTFFDARLARKGVITEAEPH